MNSRERVRCYLNEEEDISINKEFEVSIRIFFEFLRHIHSKEDKTRIERFFWQGEVHSRSTVPFAYHSFLS